MSDERDASGRAAGPVDADALDWVVRMTDPEADWEAFTTWLEADPERPERYDRMASALRDAEVAVSTVPSAAIETAIRAAPSVRPRRPARSPRWLGGAIAAVLVGSVGLGLWTEGSGSFVVETAAGEQRTVRLEDGSSIVLAGASRVRLDRSQPRFAAVDRGEVLFDVRHDPRTPFNVQVGALKLVDLGTIFDVKVHRSRTHVAVAEGAVMVDPTGAAIRLDPGQAAVIDGTSVKRQTTERADVGGWREGRLAYEDATLAEVAEDLSRTLAVPVTAAPSVAARTFRGTLETRNLRNDPRLLGRLLEVEVRAGQGGWTLEPPR